MKQLLAIIAAGVCLLVLFQINTSVRDHSDRQAAESAAETKQVNDLLRKNGYLD